MRTGIFLMPVHDPAKPLAQCMDEDLELVVRAEQLGFDEFWVGEHHTSDSENIAMPELFIAKALGLTETIRMGPAPVCLQYHNPVHVASRLAFLDHLSGGRLNVCFGPGSVPTDTELFQVDPAETGARIAEAIDVILKLWTEDPPYHFQGRFTNIHLERTVRPDLGIGALTKPLQQPHPPIAVPGVSANSASIRMAGAKGFAPFGHHMVAANRLAELWSTYSRGAEEAGRTPQRGNWRIARNIYVADTTAEAWSRARNGSLGQCLEYICRLSDLGPAGRANWKREPSTPDSEIGIDYFLEDQVIAGDPPAVVQRLLQLYEETGGFGTLVFVAHDWDDRDCWLRCLELFAREVTPALRTALNAR